jgi:hypothetical protein
VYSPFILILLRNSIATSRLISFSIRFIILTNYAIELVALYSSIVFCKSLSSVKNAIKSLLLG